MTARRRLVKVPASSANLGPGYDVLGAALEIYCELEVAEDPDGFSIDPGGPDLPRAKGNARPAGHYRELYSDASRERVGLVFADAIDAFGYEF